MWWLAPAAIIGVATAIYKICDDDAKEARREWEQKREEVKRTVHEHRAHIERHLSKAQTSYDFHVLTDMHYSSHRVGQHAYKSLQDAKKSLDVMGQMLVQAKSKRNDLKRELSKAQRPQERAVLREEIKLLNELRTSIFPDKDAVKSQRDELLAELRSMNQRTRELKLMIRDRCGERGRDWYRSLEARSNKRREKRRGRR